MRTAEERRAENEARLRDANERIMRTADRLGLADQLIPLLCECFRTDCITVIKIRADEFASVRAGAGQFLYAPGHATGRDPLTVVEENARFLVVRKPDAAPHAAEADGACRDHP